MNAYARDVTAAEECPSTRLTVATSAASASIRLADATADKEVMALF